jgi:hypothetical protein
MSRRTFASAQHYILLCPNPLNLKPCFYSEPCCLRFQLQEVRSDVKQHPYLLLSTLDDWQSCTGNPSQEAAGFPCLQVGRGLGFTVVIFVV